MYDMSPEDLISPGAVKLIARRQKKKPDAVLVELKEKYKTELKKLATATPESEDEDMESSCESSTSDSANEDLQKLCESKQKPKPKLRRKPIVTLVCCKKY